MEQRVIKFVDLFAGVGGLRLGFETALNKHSIDSQCVFSCEVHPKAQETYFLNYGECPFPDIRNVDQLPMHDVLLAGFPCQTFSYAGKRKGFGDTRGTLFFEIERLLSTARQKPRYVLLENVRGFTTHDGGRTFGTVVERLKSLGYEVDHLLLNSSNFAVPQNRVRVYIVCKLNAIPRLSIESSLGPSDSHKYKKQLNQLDMFNDSAYKVVKDILETNVDARYRCSEDYMEQLQAALNGKPFSWLHGVRMIDHRGGNSLHSWDMGLKGCCTDDERHLMDSLIANRRKKKFGANQDGKKLTITQIREFWDRPQLENVLSSLVAKGYLSLHDGRYNPVSGNMSFEVFKFLDPESISITVVSSDAHRLGVVTNDIPRRITPRECARLQGFPDSFKLHPSDKWAYHQLGNSVSVPVVTALVDDLLLNNPDFVNGIG
jgi:DNA (cytosine-5)-methyltransferase 1